AGFDAQIFDDWCDEHLCDIIGAGKFDASSSRLAMDADADLHLIFSEVKSGFAGGRDGTGGECHAHAAALSVDFASQGCYLIERRTGFREATNDFFKQDGDANAATSGGIQAILNGDVIVCYDAGNFDALGVGEFGGHLEVHNVTGIVFDDMQDAGAAI